MVTISRHTTTTPYYPPCHIEPRTHRYHRLLSLFNIDGDMESEATEEEVVTKLTLLLDIIRRTVRLDWYSFDGKVDLLLLICCDPIIQSTNPPFIELSRLLYVMQDVESIIPVLGLSSHSQHWPVN